MVVNIQRQIESVDALRLTSARNMLNQFCSYISENNPKYNWVGVYVLKKNKLILESYVGKPTIHEEITIGEGLCSQAIVQNDVVNEPDVTSNSKYLACSLETRSELVVPVRSNGVPVGEIDIDSDTPKAFTEEDEKFISKLAELISEQVKVLSD
ncbi:MAG: GAF domain-containing protein [Candidatus Thermoplasmatota archaeon]|nr:GAF domain-containing protein [Candidatus Thermoplasmatota archaeon]